MPSIRINLPDFESLRRSGETGSFLERTEDLVGSVEAEPGLSTDPDQMDDYGR